MKIFVISMLCTSVCLGFAPFAHGADWYVRPESYAEGNDDGTSYTDAWQGLPSVVWGEGGVEAGDTLYVCGLHLRTYTALPQWKIIGGGAVTSGTDDNNRTVIRGDYPGDPGIVWMAGVLAVDNWADEGDNTYSMSYASSHYADWVFEDITATSWTVLTKQTSIADCKSNASSFYMDTGAKTLYVHCSDNGDPTNRIAINSAGYWFSLGGCSYITFQNLQGYCDSSHLLFVNGIDSDNASHIKFDGCTIWYGGSAMMHFRPGNDYIEFYNCDIAWAKNGLDFSGGGSPADGSVSPRYCVVSENTFHDIGVIYTDTDAHAISWQGGWDNIVEKNNCYNCGSTICFYQLYNNQDMRNCIIRWNYVRDSHTLGGANGYGIEFACSGDNIHVDTGNQIYGNIVVNCTVAYRYTYVYQNVFYNNIASNCDISYYFTRGIGAPGGLGVNVKTRNNVSYNPATSHVHLSAPVGDGNFVYDADYNLYYPDTGTKFTYADAGSTSYYNFTQWKALSYSGCTFDTPNALTDDPEFVGAERNKFAPVEGSPLIGGGVDMGLPADFRGNSISNDIGAIAYKQYGLF